MSRHAKPIRTALWAAGNNEEQIRQAVASSADAIYIDLEDSVPEADRPAARGLVRQLLEELGTNGSLLAVRVTSLETGQTLADLEAVMCPGLYGIVLPKIEEPSEVTTMDRIIELFERRAGLLVGSVVIHPIVETASAVRLAYEIGCASSRVAHMGGVSAPGGDVNRSLGFEWTPQGLETLYLRSKILCDAKAAGVPYPISGLWPEETDLEGHRRIAVEARQLGYQGMHVLPNLLSHVEMVNEVFTPTNEQVSYWKELIEALAESERRGVASLTVRGRFVNTAMAHWAQECLEFARQVSARSGTQDRGEHSK